MQLVISLAVLLVAGVYIWRLERTQKSGITSIKQLEDTLEKEGFTVSGKEPGWIYCQGHGVNVMFGTDETDADFIRVLVPFGDEGQYQVDDPYPLNRDSKLAKLIKLDWEPDTLLCAAVDLLKPTKDEILRAIAAAFQLGERLVMAEQNNIS